MTYPEFKAYSDALEEHRKVLHEPPCEDCGTISDDRSPCPLCGMVLCQLCAEKPYESCCDSGARLDLNDSDEFEVKP